MAPDSFKGSLDAQAAAAAIGAGVRDVMPHARVRLHPISDGGEGLLTILLPAMKGTRHIAEVCGPLPGRLVSSQWGFVESGKLAIIEMAEAAGLGLVPKEERDPRITTTFGVGELIIAALDRGARSIVIGVGGSATNDGGAGMAQALGVGFLRADGSPVGAGGGVLCDVHRIDTSRLDRRLRTTSVVVACDVQNPLTGPDGATAVYARQKGASPDAVIELERCLVHYRDMLLAHCNIDVQSIPGSGAAGGLGAGLIAFCNGRLQSGIDLVLDAVGFDEHVAKADLVITGEGMLDAQTRSGKAMSGVLRRARTAGVPVIAVVGGVQGDIAPLLGPDGFADIITLVDATTTLRDAMENAASLLRRRASIIVQRFNQL